MNYIKNISLFIIIAFLIVLLSNAVESTFIGDFVVDDLITILVTIFAINTATNSLLIDDLSKLSQSKNIRFANSYREIKYSIIEQLILIAFALIFLIFRESKYWANWEYIGMIFDTLCLAVFIYSIDILRDTALAVFRLIEFRNKEND